MGVGRAKCHRILMVVALAALCSCSMTLEQDKMSDADRTMERVKKRSRQSIEEQFAKQRVTPQEEAAQRASASGMLTPGSPIWVQSGKSRILQVANPVKRVSLGNPDLAGIVVLGPRTLMLNAKQVTAASGAAPGGGPGGDYGSVSMSGRILAKEPQVAETTLVIWDGSTQGPDVHTVFVADFIDQQVMLSVTVAQLRRSAMEERGIDMRVVQKDFISTYYMGGGGGSAGGTQIPTVPPQISQPLLPLVTTGDKPTYAFILPNQNITGFIEALQGEGLATILAQPKIIAMSGQNGVFQVGGEIPIRISSGFATDIVFKPFGTMVNFIPRVSEEGDITLTVNPEVSRPDFSQTVEGIPSFRVSRASTSAKLRNGQTLVIGGLLQTDRAEEVQGVPYLMNLPILGYVFRTTTYQNEVTELMVIVTPELVRPMPGDAPIDLPTDRGPLKHEDVRTQRDPAEVTRPRIPGAP